MEEFKKMYEASEAEYNKTYSQGEYCHEQSFMWGYQEGAFYVAKWNDPEEVLPDAGEYVLVKIVVDQHDAMINELFSKLFTGYDVAFINHLGAWTVTDRFKEQMEKGDAKVIGWRKIVDFN